MKLGALEAGGTKMVCAIGDGQGVIEASVRIPTTTPEETLPQILAFFRENPVDALGIAAFGPLDLKRNSPTYGTITSTPKLPWQNTPLLTYLSDALGIPCGISTDVIAAALSEWQLGAAQGLDSCLYVTVGTGVGGGIIAERHMLTGLVHPEWGHIRLVPHPDDPLPKGVCPFHAGCLEGLAAGPALEAKWGVPAHTLAPDHIAWVVEADYLAQLCTTAVLTVSPERIVLGGGVMEQQHLFPMIHKRVQGLLNGYVQHPMVLENIAEYIVPPKLAPFSGVMGAFLLARQSL